MNLETDRWKDVQIERQKEKQTDRKKECTVKWTDREIDGQM
jgi:hypothetical protein